MCITKEAFRSCMNEKKFQEVLEEVVYQRAAYREQRAQQQRVRLAKVFVSSSCSAHYIPIHRVEHLQFSSSGRAKNILLFALTVKANLDRARLLHIHVHTRIRTYRAINAHDRTQFSGV